jgi:DnaK suppressor protein
MDQTRLQDFRQRLVAMRQDLEQLCDIAKEDSEPVMLDQQSVGRLSRMDALQRQAMGEEQARRRSRDIERIDAALARMDEDEYGACISCGEDVAPGRLKFDPAAATCIRCARRGG